MRLVRELVLSCLRYNIVFRVEHVPAWVQECFSRRIVSPTGGEFPSLGPSYGYKACANPRSSSASKLVSIVQSLLSEGLQVSSRSTYRRAGALVGTLGKNSILHRTLARSCRSTRRNWLCLSRIYSI